METNGKEKLVRIKTSDLKNEVHFRFHVENGQLYDRYNPEKLGIDGFIDEFSKALADEDTAVERIRKSAETARIADADTRFDSSFAAMRMYVQPFLKHFDADVRLAAENIDAVFHQFGNIGRQAYRQELASSYNLLQELRLRDGDVKRLNLEPWIAEHENAAKNLEKLLDVRTVETAKQTDLRTVEVRAAIDSVYRKITNRIDAMINIYGIDFVPGFVAEYNAHATEYRNTLAQHLGRIHKKNANNTVSNNNNNNDNSENPES